MSNAHYTLIFAPNGGRTFITIVTVKAFVTDGKVKPTNSYYGNSQVLRPTYEPVTIPKGTKLVSCPGGDWFIIDGKLMGFSLDDRNPNDVGTFEKHYDPTRSRMSALYGNGSFVYTGDGLPKDFTPMYAEWNKR